MTANSSFVRKVAYIVLIVVLLVPLSLLSQPRTVQRDVNGDIVEKDRGGELARMRQQAGLSQAELGDIDPASETMKLATFGLRGIAVVMLWNQAAEAKKKEDWDNLSLALEQIARLQPNFLTVWEHQAHNLSYNVSVEFDDYRQRYHWVKKGINYLVEGTRYNQDEPRLLWYMGWVVGQKIGRSDERKQFRVLFKDDTEFQEMFQRERIDLEATRGPDGKPDNWLVGREWYLRGQTAVDQRSKPLRGKSPVLFHSSPTMSRINFYSDLMKEPKFDEERVRAEAQRSFEELTTGLGERSLPTSAGFNIQLNEVERLTSDKKDLYEKLEKIVPGATEKIRAEKIASLPTELRRAIETPEADRTSAQKERAAEAERSLIVGVNEIAERADTKNSVEARTLAQQVMRLDERIRYTMSSRQVVNYDFWRDRCESAATERGTRAVQLLFDAKAKYADLEGAKKQYEEAFRDFAELFKQWPRLMEDSDADDVTEGVEAYIKILDQLDLRDEQGGILPADFPLADFMKMKGKEDLIRFRSEKKPEDEKPVEEKPAAEKPAEEAKPTEESPTADKPKEAPADEKLGAEKPEEDRN